MTILVSVPKDGTVLDILAERYRAAFAKMAGGRTQWIEGTLELAIVVAEAREKLPDHRAFSRWVTHHQLEHLHNNDRTALIAFAKDLVAARKLLEQSNSISWRTIWETRPNKSQRTLTKNGKGTLRARTGHAARTRVPSVMQDNPPPVRKAVVLKALTPEQVDPDFKGTPLEFAAKYGHVPLHTKDQIEHHKQQELLSAWLGTVGDLDRAANVMLTALAVVNPATLHEWKGKPAKVEKLRARCNSIGLAVDALRTLCGG